MIVYLKGHQHPTTTSLLTPNDYGGHPPALLSKGGFIMLLLVGLKYGCSTSTMLIHVITCFLITQADVNISHLCKNRQRNDHLQFIVFLIDKIGNLLTHFADYYKRGQIQCSDNNNIVITQLSIIKITISDFITLRRGFERETLFSWSELC